MNMELAVRTNNNLPAMPGILAPTTALSLADIMTYADVFARSGFFQDSRDAAQAAVKVIAGNEMGIPPMAAMTGIYIVKGRPSVGANIMAAKVKASGRYDYRVAELTDDRCEITFFQRAGSDWQNLGSSIFTREDARRAQTQNVDKFARNMLFARAMSNGVKWYVPDVFLGPIYTPDELGATVNEETGEVITVEAWDPRQVAAPGASLPPAAQAAAAPPAAELTPTQLKNRALKALAKTDGWVPAMSDKPAVAERLSSLLSRPVAAGDLQSLTAEDIDAARAELEARNHQRARYYAVRAEIVGTLSDEHDRALLAELLGIPVETRRRLTSQQWAAAADGLPDYARRHASQSVRAESMTATVDRDADNPDKIDDPFDD